MLRSKLTTTMKEIGMMIKTRRRRWAQGTAIIRDEDMGVTYPKDQVSYYAVTNIAE